MMFLHDGRARNLEEVILWHGGEALESRNQFVGMPKDRRQAYMASAASPSAPASAAVREPRRWSMIISPVPSSPIRSM